MTTTNRLTPRHRVLHRLSLHSGGDVEYRIGQDYVDADDAPPCEIVMGPVTGSWWDVPLPPCPDCGGEIVWYEAGYVPGTRCCTACESLFTVDTRKQRI